MKVLINEDLKDQLQNLDCMCNDDFINVTRHEDKKFFFVYGKCKLHLDEESYYKYTENNNDTQI
jgi:hypothetical protein